MRVKDKSKIVEFKRRRRKEILDVAREVFSKKGYADTSIEDISRTAKIAKGSVYVYFRNKKQLFLSAVDDGMDELRDRVLAAVEKEKEPLRKIEKAIEAYLGFFEKHESLARVMIHEQSQFQKEIQKKYLQRYYEHLNKTEEIFRDGIRKGVIKDMNPRDAVSILTNILNGLVYMWQLEERKYSLLSKLPVILKIYFEGIVKK